MTQLKARYKYIREPILVALNTLLHDPNIELEDAKAQAALHGVKITAASVNAARTLLSRMDSPTAPAATTPPAAPAREPRRPRAPEKMVDAKALVRAFVAKMKG